ncbi:hypothetical protein BDB01DRAFT_723653 [Pilobolus umbonatus]|nr:hypothetical protein BDB01DRAFT_723653 [Pilobolus umbonatus]
MSNQINDNDSTNRRSSRSYGKKRKSDSPYSTIKQSSSQTKTYPPTPTKERKHRKQPHELLTDSQKKANHIASEQKRRQNIRIGFDQLIDIVPSLNHGNRSEALILQKSVDHIRHLISIKSSLKNQVRDLHGTLGDE